MFRYRERVKDCSSDSDDDDLSALPKLNRSQDDVGSASAQMDMDSKSEVPTTNLSMKRKVNNIWASIAQEQSINEDLCKVNMNRLSDRLGWDRGSESYDYMRKQQDDRSDPGSEEEEIDLDYGVSDIENEFEDECGDKLPKKTSKVPLVERLEDANKIARDLAKKLNEPKVELLERTVQVLGRTKVFDLFHMTEDIENSGGMLIINGSRRRTPGGVFFFQLRKDKRITKKQKDFIFSDDRAIFQRKAYKKMKKKNQRRNGTKPAKMEMEAVETAENVLENGKELPDPVQSEVPEAKESVQTSDVELEEGEIE